MSKKVGLYKISQGNTGKRYNQVGKPLLIQRYKLSYTQKSYTACE